MIRTLALIATTLFGAPVAADDLVVEIAGLRSTSGAVEVCLWTAPATGFPDCIAATPALRTRLPAADAARVRLADVPTGPVALSVLHDENGNGTLDTNFLGIPSDGVAVSNNLRLGARAPRFADAAFHAGVADRVEVRVVYP